VAESCIGCIADDSNDDDHQHDDDDHHFILLHECDTSGEEKGKGR
jgi:hypothetical protein